MNWNVLKGNIFASSLQKYHRQDALGYTEKKEIGKQFITCESVQFISGRFSWTLVTTSNWFYPIMVIKWDFPDCQVFLHSVVCVVDWDFSML